MSTVRLAYLHEESVSHSWAESMRALRAWDRAHGGLLADDPLALRCNTGRLVQVRNFAVRLFLDKCEEPWLWMCDTDMGFEPDLLERLVGAADPEEVPVVGALCFAMMETGPDGFNGQRFRITPTMYMLGHTAEGHASFCYYGPYPADTCVQVAGTGAACLLVHRSVLTGIRDRWGDVWFTQVEDTRNSVVGEDLSFCLRVGALNRPIFVHTGVKTSHHKQVWITEDDYAQTPLVLVDEAGNATPDVPIEVDLPGSLTSLATSAHVRPDGMLKLDDDLLRYAKVIAQSHPAVVVETGTRAGASARWFADRGCDVVTVDVNPPPGGDLIEQRSNGRVIYYVTGDSADPAIAEQVSALVAGRRAMVSLDSDHSAEHVAAEIELYGPLVADGCYLVVEDTIFGYAPDPILRQHGLADMVGSPLDAVAHHLDGVDGWARDVGIERVSPISHHPAGWWIKVPSSGGGGDD